MLSSFVRIFCSWIGARTALVAVPGAALSPRAIAGSIDARVAVLQHLQPLFPDNIFGVRPPTREELQIFRVTVLRFKQHEMAAALGIARGAYSRYEQKKSPTPFPAVFMPKLQALGWKPPEDPPSVVKETPAAYEQQVGAPMIPVGYPVLKMRYAGEVPAGDWGDPLASEDFVEVEAKLEHPDRYMTRVVGMSCYPALHADDMAIWHQDRNPPYGAIVLAQRKGDHACTVKLLAWDEESKANRLVPINPAYDNPPDGDGWGVIARLVHVSREVDGGERSWYRPKGLRPKDLE